MLGCSWLDAPTFDAGRAPDGDGAASQPGRRGGAGPRRETYFLRGTKGVPWKGGLHTGQHEGLNMKRIESKRDQSSCCSRPPFLGTPLAPSRTSLKGGGMQKMQLRERAGLETSKCAVDALGDRLRRPAAGLRGRTLRRVGARRRPQSPTRRSEAGVGVARRGNSYEEN